MKIVGVNERNTTIRHTARRDVWVRDQKRIRGRSQKTSGTPFTVTLQTPSFNPTNDWKVSNNAHQCVSFKSTLSKKGVLTCRTSARDAFLENESSLNALLDRSWSRTALITVRPFFFLGRMKRNCFSESSWITHVAESIKNIVGKRANDGYWAMQTLQTETDKTHEKDRGRDEVEGEERWSEMCRERERDWKPPSLCCHRLRCRNTRVRLKCINYLPVREEITEKQRHEILLTQH